MLSELLVRDLGVIPEARVVLGPGLTAVTGETGAGKTMLVEAISLLVGGRADAALVRAGASEAVVEGRFVLDRRDRDDEVVLTRVVPADGRSRAYRNGRLATATELADEGRALVDLHGQLHALRPERAEHLGHHVFGGIGGVAQQGSGIAQQAGVAAGK